MILQLQYNYGTVASKQQYKNYICKFHSTNAEHASPHLSARSLLPSNGSCLAIISATMRAGLVGRWVGPSSHSPRSTVVRRMGEVWRSEAVRSVRVDE